VAQPDPPHHGAAPTAGPYRVDDRVRTPAGTTGQIQLGTGQVRSVATNGAWQTVTGPTVALAAGLNTVSVSAPAAGGGWYLNFLTLTRA
jgi:hypothetical protein